MARDVCWRVATQSQPGAIVGNGKKGPIRGPLRPTGSSPGGEPAAANGGNNRPKIEQGKTCGAMCEQHGYGNESAPQKFIHLIGCRDPSAGTRTRTHRR